MKQFLRQDFDRPSYGSEEPKLPKSGADIKEMLSDVLFGDLKKQFREFTERIKPILDLLGIKLPGLTGENTDQSDYESRNFDKEDVDTKKSGDSTEFTSRKNTKIPEHSESLKNLVPNGFYKDLPDSMYPTRKDWATNCYRVDYFLESNKDIPAPIKRKIKGQMHSKSDRILPDLMRRFGEEYIGKNVAFTVSVPDETTGEVYEIVFHGRGDIHGKNARTGETGRILGFSARIKSFRKISPAEKV